MGSNHDGKQRCQWLAAVNAELYVPYHDAEWGTPVHDDRKHFELLVMEAMSCGLSWELMLRKREVFRQCFAGFDPARVARFTQADVDAALATPGMIRSPRKIAAMVGNAKAFIAVQQEFGSFDAYVWSFTGDKSLVYRSHRDRGQYVTRNELSDRVAADLRRRGFKYVGSTIIYSHLQGIGVINDHSPSCFRYKELVERYPTQVIDD